MKIYIACRHDMWTFTLLEEHNGNLEFCSLGNSQIKYPFFFPLFLHGFSSSWMCRAICFFHPLAGCEEVPLHHCMPPRPSPKNTQSLLDSLLHPGELGAPGWSWGRRVSGDNCSMAWQAGWQEACQPCL